MIRTFKSIHMTPLMSYIITIRASVPIPLKRKESVKFEYALAGDYLQPFMMHWAPTPVAIINKGIP